MCAIAGAIRIPLSAECQALMLETMRRRGPDDRGVYHRDECILLHTRLAIIDPTSAKQPMTLRWQGKTYTIVYNGELYNTEELRAELCACGHSFETHSDTEVLLHAYAQWQDNCLEKLNGIYAFAVWEETAHRLFLARDRIGVKPLFYAQTAKGLAFASEIKTILASQIIKPTLDEEGALQILMLGPGRIPGSGVFHGIQELEPGYFGVYEDGKWNLRRYWSLCDKPHTDSFKQTVEEVRYLVLDAIQRQMVSDVPIGTFLSGGLDSSIITAVCANEFQKVGKRLPTFSVDYLNQKQFFQPGKFQPNADDDYIQMMLDAVEVDPHFTVLTPEDLAGELENATMARDLPGMADVDFSLLAFSKQIRNQVKVALSGECADEIFGGYPWYRDTEIREAEGFPWAQTTRQRAEMINPLLHDSAEAFVQDHYLDTCRSSDILPVCTPLERRMKEMVNLNFRWFMQTLLDRKDRMSMYCGLEVRVPFCDYRIAEYLYSTPWEYKDYQGREKGLLRHAVKDLLPEPVLRRKKSPYPKTFDPHYEELVTHRLNELLQSGESPLFHLIEPSCLREYLSQEGEWPWYGQLMRRPQTIAYFLQVDFWLRKYRINFNF